MPWARPPLLLNDRSGYHAKAKITRMIRDSTCQTARSAHLGGRMLSGVEVGLVWYPGNRSVCDSDNLASTLKAAIDGLRDSGTLAADDGRTVLRTWQRAIPRDMDPFDTPAGRVILVIEPATLLPHYPPGEVATLVNGTYLVPPA